MAQLKDLLVEGKSRFIDKIYASDQFISKVVQGTPPFLIDSSTLVSNLNADLVDGQHFSYANTNNTPTYLWGTSSNGTNYLVSRASMHSGIADKIVTVTRSTDAWHYPTFVDSDNSTATEESLYTAGGLRFNPSTRAIAIGTTSKATGSGAIAAGTYATADGTNAVAIGGYVTAIGSGAFARGTFVSAAHGNGISTAFGSNWAWDVKLTGNANVTSYTCTPAAESGMAELLAKFWSTHSGSIKNAFILGGRIYDASLADVTITNMAYSSGTLTFTFSRTLSATAISNKTYYIICCIAGGEGSFINTGFTGQGAKWSLAGGRFSMALGDYGAISYGHLNIAGGGSSAAFGNHTLTYNSGEFACGSFNNSVSGSTKFSVGIGSADNARKNAFEIVSNGNAFLNGVFTINAPAYSANATWTYPGGSYASVASPNIRLIGDSTYGLSTIEFISQKGETSINKPSDCAFIQFQPYGTTTQSAVGSQPTLASSGELNRLVIGVNNDSTDTLVLQTPSTTGLKHAVGTGLSTIWDEGNDGSGSGLDADLLDGYHLSQITPVVTKRDFSNGTLVKTNISFPGTNTSVSEAFLLTVKGNGYGGGIINFEFQGYVYYASGYENPKIISSDFIIYSPNSIDKIYTMSIDNKLCFWWARQAYWQGFHIFCTTNTELYQNRVTEVQDVSKPTGSFEQNYTPKISLTSSNYTTYTVTKTGGGASGTWDISITGSATYATTAGTANSIAWANISGKPINFKAYSGSLASGGWKTLQGKDSAPSIAISYNNSAANWNSGTYSASMVWGCSDTRGLIDCAYNTPKVTFGGCSYGGATDDNPTWYFKLTGTTGTDYNLDSRWSLSTHNHDSVYLPLAGGSMNNGAVITIQSNGVIAQNQANTSNYTNPIVWLKNGTGWYKSDNTTLYTYQPQIGQHNTGNSSGAITILPYATDTSPWGGTVGLYIGKTTLKWENNTIIHSSNIGSYAAAVNHTHSNYVLKTGDSMSGQLSIQTQTTAKTSPTYQQLVINGPTYDASATVDLKYYPGIGFHLPGRTWANLIWNGYFTGVNSDFSGYTGFYGSGFWKNGSSNDYILLGAGGHKAISDFATSGHTHSTYVLKAGDTMTGQLYINYDEDVGLNQSGSLVIGTKAGANIAIDANEIMARSNSSASTLYLNNEGGNVVTGSGNFGIGTSSPSQKLHVSGNIYSTGKVFVNNTTTAMGADSASVIWWANSSGYPLVASANVVRRGASLTTGQLGDATYPWAGVYSNMIYANIAGSNTAGGISLYTTTDPLSAYGIVFRGTGTSTGQGGKLGRVQGDWATYFTMNDSTNRGWIFRRGTTNVASIAGQGEAFLGAVGNNNYIVYPNGATSVANSGSVTGAIAIRLPSAATKCCTMLKMTVEIYNYVEGTSSTYIIAGYNYNDWGWYNCTAYSLRQGSSDKGNLTVRYGDNGTRHIIWIGETNTSWSYPQVHVKDVTLGHSSLDFNIWAQGWEVGFDTSFGNVRTTITSPATNPDSSLFVKYGGNQTSIGSGSPVSGAQNWCTSTNLPNGNALIYNNSGVEYSMLYSFYPANLKYGTILRWGYTDKYLYITRKYNDSWTDGSTNWAKISAGYADSAGNADTVDNEHSSAFAHRQTYNNMVHSGNEYTWISGGYTGDIWINYRTASGTTDGSINGYILGNGKGGQLAKISLNTFHGNITGSAETVKTITTSGNANYYFTVVDSNNSSAAAETLYTPSLPAINPSTGVLNWGTGSSRKILQFSTNTTWDSGLRYSWANNTTIAFWGKHKNTQFVWHAGTDADLDGTATKTYDFQVGRDTSGTYNDVVVARIAGNRIWHEGNDGSGSGLDADFLDGLHASAFARNATLGTTVAMADAGGTITVEANKIIPVTTTNTSTVTFSFAWTGASNCDIAHILITGSGSSKLINIGNMSTGTTKKNVNAILVTSGGFGEISILYANSTYYIRAVGS